MLRIRTIVDFLFHGSFFISAAAASLAASSFWLFDLNVDLLLLIFIFSSTLFAYNLARCFSFLPFFGSLERTFVWYVENKRVLLSIIFFSGLTSTALVFRLEVDAWLFLSHLIFIVLLYSWPIKGRCLRMIPCLKIFLIAYCWASVCVGLVLVQAGLDLFSEPDYVCLFLDRLLFIVAITLAFDLRDVTCDREDGLVTLPLLLGERVAKALSLLMLIAVIWLASAYLRSSMQLVFDSGVLFLSAILVLYATPSRHRYYYLGLIDGLIFFRAVGVLF